MRVLMAVAGLVLALGGPRMPKGGGVLDGFVIGHVPREVGPSTSDFESEPEEGVRFTSRVSERETADGGHSVDLMVIVIRSDGLATLGDLRDFMSAYHERDPASWTKVQVGSRPGLKDAGRVFWLVEPGVAISVMIDIARFGAGELMTVAESVRKQ
ncbi:hypothetical protein [Streptosporangium sp. 'caverna']|uniref:hypothetical protein n=1 Tax=Streptosporangium sp. 'caverna' TaxID=2202249 RepID=UPI000D7E4357|nr:hypothetical protein [Streptosporangium sp. 'caverna']AWS44294.1 hypothetical protein DKM19_26030 [Streptosporangium sp. 'caverna']